MNKEHQETLLQTIRARFERNEKGGIEAIFDKVGQWEIVPLSATRLTGYFTSALSNGIDQYGNTKDDPK